MNWMNLCHFLDLKNSLSCWIHWGLQNLHSFLSNPPNLHSSFPQNSLYSERSRDETAANTIERTQFRGIASPPWYSTRITNRIHTVPNAVAGECSLHAHSKSTHINHSTKRREIAWLALCCHRSNFDNIEHTASAQCAKKDSHILRTSVMIQRSRLQDNDRVDRHRIESRHRTVSHSNPQQNNPSRSDHTKTLFHTLI